MAGLDRLAAIADSRTLGGSGYMGRLLSEEAELEGGSALND